MVFEAEKAMSSKGFAFHVKCLSCRACSKRLEAGSMCVGEGGDPEIYCKGCDSRLHGGGTGYRGGSLSEQSIDDQERDTANVGTAIGTFTNVVYCSRLKQLNH